MISDERMRELLYEVRALSIWERFDRFARAVEREAREQALEEAARIAEAYEPRCDICPSGCANAIRALIEREDSPQDEDCDCIGFHTGQCKEK